MFIFARPLRAVAAGLAVALLIVYRACEPPDHGSVPGPLRRTRRLVLPPAGLRYRARRFVTFPFPAACRPLFRSRVGFRV